jgi:hypothetical protein
MMKYEVIRQDIIALSYRQTAKHYGKHETSNSDYYSEHVEIDDSRNESPDLQLN